MQLGPGAYGVSNPSRSKIKLTGGNGFGSGNTKIRRFTTELQHKGSDILYVDSDVEGGSIVINSSGIYAIVYTDYNSAAYDIGLSVNSSELSTGLGSIAESNRLVMVSSNGNGWILPAVAIVPLCAGDILRAHVDVVPQSSTNSVSTTLTITKIA